MNSDNDHEDPIDDLLEELADRINDIAKQIAADHYSVSQEPAFTSRLAQEIESEIRRHPLNANGHKIEVSAQDVPDRGSASKEKKIGADLYVSVVRRDTAIPVSKGLLIQAKWDHTARASVLGEQITAMTDRTDSSYISIYTPDDVICVKASEAFTVRGGLGYPIGDLIAESLRCNAGDAAIGRNIHLPRAQGMRDMLNELAAPRGLSFTLT